MQERLKELKTKIEEYNLFIEKNDISKVNNKATEIKEEIERIKKEIEEKKVEVEGKTKIEKMKLTLNISSLESELSLKEIDLEEAETSGKKEYQLKIDLRNKQIERQKEDLQIFINETEKDLEESIKNYKITPKILLDKDLEEIRGYLKNIISAEEKTKESLENELNKFKKDYDDAKYKLETAKDEEEWSRQAWLETMKRQPYNWLGNYDEDMADDIKYAQDNSKAEWDKKVKEKVEASDRFDSLKKQEEKINVKLSAIKKKIEGIEEMADETIKEVIQEKIQEENLVIPDFIKIGKFFKIEKN
ncbi:MAG: hypothetical protein CR959_01535 [Fusobacteriales bacterium]|nr:MAG: hypothetical protein CR959_01535 [Fusobacteriales bacterium]